MSKKKKFKGNWGQGLFLNCLCLASHCSWMLISLSIAAHDHSSSTGVFDVCKMVLNRFNAMLVWSDRPSSILGCLVTGTVMKAEGFFFVNQEYFQGLQISGLN